MNSAHSLSIAASSPPQSVVASKPIVARPSTILALDLGTTTGYATKPASGPIVSGTMGFKPNRFEGGGMVFLRFSHWLSELNEKAGPIDLVVYEEVRAHRGTMAAQIYGSFLGHLTAWSEFRDVPYQGVPVGTIKKFIAGKGNADKSQVIAAVRARGYAPIDDNEADAIAILLWAIHTNGGVQ
jgi:Holliday junction resolvasome RuvABC endonuclease subunit